MGEPKFYAVQAGHRPGVYTTWADCMSQIRGFKGAKFKSFATAEDAQLFLTGKDPSLDPASSSYTAKFYGVRSGRVPGVYTDWASAEAQVKGVTKPKVKCFPTREEAEEFVRSGPNIATEPEIPAAQQFASAPPPPAPAPAPSPPVLEDDSLSSASSDFEILSSKPSIFSTREAIGAPPAPKRRKPTVNDSNLLEREPIQAPAPTPAPAPVSKIAAVPRPTSVPRSTSMLKAVARAVNKKSPILKIYTDGSALSNGREGAKAGVGVWFGDDDVRNISEPLAGPRQTNQRAELTAILRALDVAPAHRDVLIFTDSQYAIKCVTVWHHAWARNNWITSVGRPVENRDLVESILQQIVERQRIHGSETRFEWVKGHTGLNDGNCMADRLATEGAMMGRDALERGGGLV